MAAISNLTRVELFIKNGGFEFAETQFGCEVSGKDIIIDMDGQKRFFDLKHLDQVLWKERMTLGSTPSGWVFMWCETGDEEIAKTSLKKAMKLEAQALVQQAQRLAHLTAIEL